MKKILFIIVLVLIITIVSTFVAFNINAGKRHDIVSPEGNISSTEEEILSSLKASAKLLRKDKQEVVASVDGVEITAHTLNLYRTLNAFSKHGIDFTEYELINQILKNTVIENFMIEEVGFIYEENLDEVLIAQYDLEADKLYSAAAGLTILEYNEMNYLSQKSMSYNSEFYEYAFANIGTRDGAFKDPQYDEYYESYQKAIEEGNVDKGAEILMEIYDFYVQQLIENADIKIY